MIWLIILLLLSLGLIVLGPIFISLNLLFGLTILPVTFWTWLSALWLSGVIGVMVVAAHKVRRRRTDERTPRGRVAPGSHGGGSSAGEPIGRRFESGPPPLPRKGDAE